MNLCTNAADAMTETGGKLNVRLESVEAANIPGRDHSNVNPGPHLKMTVSDTGHGMTPDIMEKIFELDNGMHVKFITGAMYSPKGVSWHAHGIKPDFLVEQAESTLKALSKLEPGKRFYKDVATITAYKLLKREDG